MPSIVDKILARAAGKPQVSVGAYITCQVDLAMVHDSSGPRRLGPKLAELARTV